MKNIKRIILLLMVIVTLFSSLLPTFVYADEVYDNWPQTPESSEVDDEKKLLSVESMISLLLNSIANSLNFLVSVAVGQQVIIDDLVFNHEALPISEGGYPPTKLDYFERAHDANSNPIIWGDWNVPAESRRLTGLESTVNKCYNFFRAIAILVYMIMLIYMGIRILLASTGQSVSQYKTLFMYWVVGVIILFFYPYVMKYTIRLNDAFVKVVSDNRGPYGQIVAPKRNSLKPVTGDLYELDFGSNPFDSTGTDYMSMIANDANRGKSAAISLTYIILTWQLITLIIHYYKRVFMVGFLIAIFPLVAMFYAIDKIGDGKSQAFNHWNKEFMLNVLIQSFHAIVYVFVCGSVYAAYRDGTGIDYILVIIGSTFLFTGEEIIKSIFSQESPAGGVKALKDTAAGTIAKVAIAKNVVKGVTKPIIGKNSIPVKAMNSVNQIKATRSKEKAFDALARPMEAPNAGLRLDHVQSTMAAIDADSSLSNEEKAARKREALQLANAVATVNNPNSRSVEELQSAYATIQAARGSNSAILQDLKLTEDQMNAMNSVGAAVAGMVASGVRDSVTIDREIQMRLGYVLDGMSDQEKDKYRNMMLLNMSMYGAARYDTDPTERTYAELDGGVSEITSAINSFVSSDDVLNDLEEDEAAKARTMAQFAQFKAQLQQNSERWAESFHQDGSVATEGEKELAHSLYIIANRKKGLYTTAEYLDAANKISEHMEDSEVAGQMAQTLDMDVDLLKHMLGRRLQIEGKSTAEVDAMVKDYKEHPRYGLDEDDLSGHELVDIAMTTDAAEREELRKNYAKAMIDARMETNTAERDLTRQIAEEILVANEVDIEEGGMSKTRFLNGQTREQILEERKQAKRNLWRNLAGYSDTQAMGEYSDEYLEAMRTYNKQFLGDQEGDYDYTE